MNIEKSVRELAMLCELADRLMLQIHDYYVDVKGVEENDFYDMFSDYIEHDYDYKTFLKKIDKPKTFGVNVNTQFYVDAKDYDEALDIINKKLDECTKETEISLIIVRCGSDLVELTIESQEPDNITEPEHQEPTYVVWITAQGDTVEKLIHPYPFEKMEVREIIHIMIDIYMDKCK